MLSKEKKTQEISTNIFFNLKKNLVFKNLVFLFWCFPTKQKLQASGEKTKTENYPETIIKMCDQVAVTGQLWLHRIYKTFFISDHIKDIVC
jgi:hypothetical protein